MTNHETLMRRAMHMAATARTHARPNPWVGAVVVCVDGSVYEGATQPPGGPHAEIVAMRKAATNGWRLDNHTLVVTLEPCAMCAGAIAQARISKVIFGAWDEKAGAVGSVWDVLRDPRAIHRVEVESGVLQKECAALLSEFFKNYR